MVRFLGKNPQRKLVREVPANRVSHIIEKPERIKKITEENKENKEVKNEKDMADDRLEKIEQIMGTKAPKRKVKREKRDKGLIERTENSTILLTEDNKMVLTD